MGKETEETWNVDEAVSQVITWIHEGSALPFLGLAEDPKLRELYHDCFQEAKDNNVNWCRAQVRVRPLAYMVGALATMFAAVDQALEKTAKPEQVLPRHAWRAAYLISKACTFGTAPVVGAICPNFPFPSDCGTDCGTQEDNDKIADHLGKIFKILNVIQV
jgi:hypothetical protein